MIKVLALLMFTSCANGWMKSCDKYKGKRKEACIADLREQNEQYNQNIKDMTRNR
jgi:hypothetical protein